MKNNKLNPCPFCGSQSISTAIDTGQGLKWGRAVCCDCSCTGPEVRTNYDTSENAPWRKAALKEWNTRQPSAWIRTDDRLPENGVDVLCLHYHGSCLVAMHFDDEEPQDIWRKNGGKTRDITHWMPIQKLPESNQNHDAD